MIESYLRGYTHNKMLNCYHSQVRLRKTQNTGKPHPYLPQFVTSLFDTKNSTKHKI